MARFHQEASGNIQYHHRPTVAFLECVHSQDQRLGALQLM